MIQLDFFLEPPSEVDVMRAEFRELRESHDKQRRSLFAKLNQLTKIIADLKEDQSRIERLLLK